MATRGRGGPDRRGRRSRYRIERADQLEALRSPARLDLLDTVSAIGPCSVAEVSVRLGAKRESLYFHVKRLEAVGLLRVVEHRPTARRREAVYDTPSRELVVDTTDVDACVRIAEANVRQTRRSLAPAFRSGARTEGPARELQVARIKGWLGESELVRANALLDELHALLRRGRPREGADLFTLTTALVPSEPRD